MSAKRAFPFLAFLSLLFVGSVASAAEGETHAKVVDTLSKECVAPETYKTLEACPGGPSKFDIHQKRGAAIRLTGIKEIDRATGDIADMVSSSKVKPIEVMSRIEAACDFVRRNRYMCDLHKRLEPTMDTESCHVCEQ